MSNFGQCALCHKNAELRESHVLPAFVFRWLKGRSITGHIRYGETPNRRVQDGDKKPWFCDACETRLSGYETKFANEVFYPWQQDTSRIRYQEWLLKFCASISWRVLNHVKGMNPNSQYTDEQEQLAQLANESWRAFLLGRAPHPGQFEQHLLIMDVLAGASDMDMPNNINRYLAGPIEMDIIGTDHMLMTYAKLGRFFIFGRIQKGRDKWVGTKVHVKDGILQPGRFEVPYGLKGYLFDRAEYVGNFQKRISPVQRNKIAAAFDANIEDKADSDQVRAMLADAEMFGMNAIMRKSDLE